jgi:beta-glucanase (GH16 family)
VARIMARNVTVKDGVLSLGYKREQVGGQGWSSSFIDTVNSFAQQYGHFEARIKVPTVAKASAGVWPAFWLSRQSASAAQPPAVKVAGQRGEIDIMECWGEPSTTRGDYRPGSGSWSILSDTTGKDTRKKSGWWTPAGAARLSDDFHVFGLDWTPDGFTTTLDGVAAATVPYASLGYPAEVFNAPFYVRLNVQIGQPSYWGVPNSDTKDGAMLVEWVRVWTA